jgi:hypothetical protein
LSATAECIECNTIELTITNLSDNSGIQQTLKGGEFKLYWDDANDNRTPIPDFVIDGGWTSSSTLAYNGLKTITFIKPTGAEPVKYVVVYKGNICQNPANLDSNDENAIAITTVTAPDNCCPTYASGCGCASPGRPSLIIAELFDIDYYTECIDAYCSRRYPYQIISMPNIEGAFVANFDYEYSGHWCRYVANLGEMKIESSYPNCADSPSDRYRDLILEIIIERGTSPNDVRFVVSLSFEVPGTTTHSAIFVGGTDWYSSPYNCIYPPRTIENVLDECVPNCAHPCYYSSFPILGNFLYAVGSGGTITIWQ